MTKKEKIEQFDAVKADRDTMLLVLYDVVNGKFGTPAVLDCREYDKRLRVGTTLKMSASWRAMPLFLIFWHNPGEKNKTPFFMTETELEELCHRDDCTITQRMLRDAYQTLVRDRHKSGEPCQ
jgi:hypothetical protein